MDNEFTDVITRPRKIRRYLQLLVHALQGLAVERPEGRSKSSVQVVVVGNIVDVDLAEDLCQ